MDDIEVEGTLEVDQDDDCVSVRITSTDKQRSVTVVVKKSRVLVLDCTRGQNITTIESFDHSAFKVD